MLKDYQSFLNQRNEMSVSFLIFLLVTCVLTFNSINFNPSEMSKTCISVKNAFLLVLFTMIVKNVVPLFGFSSVYFCFCLKK